MLKKHYNRNVFLPQTYLLQHTVIQISPFRLLKTIFLLGICCSKITGASSSAYRRGDAFYDPLIGSKAPFRKKALTTCIAAAAWYSLSCLQIVTSGDECLVERFGMYHRKLGPGWHLVLKPFESVSFHVTTREQVLDFPPQQCYTLHKTPL